MRIVGRIIDVCLLILACIAGAALGFLLIAICFSTFCRFVLNNPMSNLIEYSAYSLVYVAFLAAPWLLKSHSHVNVDMLETALKPVPRQVLKICTNLMGLVISAVICYYGTVVTVSNFVNNIKILDSMGTPQWLLVGAVPLGSFFLTIQFIRNYIEEGKQLKAVKAGVE